MTLRPELTFRSALHALLRWSWLILIIAVVAAGAARAMADSRMTTSYKATTQIREQQIEQDTDGRYPSITSATTSAPPDADHFLVPAVAAAVAKTLGTVTTGELLANLAARPIDVSEAELSYEASNKAEVAAPLTAYANAYVDYRRAQQRTLIETQLAAAQQSAQFDSGAQVAVNTLHGALEGTIGRVPNPPGVSVTKAEPSVSPRLATLGGLMAGIALGVLVALALNYFDPRVRRASELEPADIDVFQATPDGLAAIRVNLELTAVGDRGGIVTVTAPDRAGALPSATALARSFSDAGVPVLIVDLASGNDTPGVRNFLDGSDGALRRSDLGPAADCRRRLQRGRRRLAVHGWACQTPAGRGAEARACCDRPHAGSRPAPGVAAVRGSRGRRGAGGAPEHDVAPPGSRR